MNSEQLMKIKQCACDYATTKMRFANMTVVSVEETTDYDEDHGPCYAIKLALSHSAEEIEKLVSEGAPEEAAIMREFLKGDFVLRVVVAGEVVIASEWENMDVC